MSQELTLNASLAYADSGGTEDGISIIDFIANVVTKSMTRYKQSIPTSEVPIVLGDLSSLGYAIFVNRDITNSISLRVTTGGSIFAKLRPNGGFAFLELGSGAQIPYAIASGDTCLLEAMIVSL